MIVMVSEIILKVDLRTRKGFKLSKRYELLFPNKITLDELISSLDEMIRGNFETK